VVAADQLLDEVWGDEPPASGVRLVQVYVSQLRKVLGEGVILTRPPGYVLEASPDSLDLQRFEGLVAQARGAEPADAAATLQKALALWRGPPLADVAYDSFAQIEIARLQELRLSALEARIEADLRLGRHAALVGELEALVREHPDRERLCGQLMLALYRSGRQAAALETYQQARRVLVEELAIEPGRELRELEKAILQQDPSLDFVSPSEETAEAPEIARGAFVGRDAELEELLEGFSDAVAGRGRLFLLVGEPGIGKSRLAEEVIRHARAHRAEVLVGRCWEGGGAPAYWPWVQSIREYVRHADAGALRSQLGAGAADVAQIVPELREILPDVPERLSVESESARFRLFDSTAAFLRSAAAECPLVVVLDDLHAADEPSLLLLRLMAAGLGTSRILVVGTFRDVDPTVREPLASTLAELAREQVTRRLQLTGLAEEDVGRFIELNTGTTPGSELVAAIHEETEGNPLFVGEVVRLLAAEGHLADIDSRTLLTLGIPQGVREVIGRRLRRLSEECTHVLNLASVLGREFRLDVLKRLSELPADRLLEVLDEAVAARLVSDVPGSLGRLRFAHALIRDTLYDELTTPRRVQLHRRVGEVLEDFYSQEDELHLAELAHHFFQAAPGGDVERAVDYARRAGEQAVRLLAFEEAARLYGLALEALELTQPVDAALRGELLLGLGEAQARAGDEPAAAQTFLRAAEIARSAGLPEQLARAALGYGGRFVWVVAGIDDDVVPLLEQALAALGEKDNSLRVRVLARLSGALRDQLEPERRARLSAEAVEMARRLGDSSALAYALDGRYSAIWGPETVEERIPIVDEILRLADETGDRERAIQGRFYRTVALLELGETSTVYEELGVMERLADELRQPAQRWYVSVLRTILALFEGRFEEARALVTKTHELAPGRADRRINVHLQTFLLHREQGRVEEVIEETERFVKEMPTIDVLRCFVADLYGELGRKAEARAILSSFAETDFGVRVDNDKLAGWCLLVEVCAALGDSAYAWRLYELLLPHADRNAVSHPAYAAGSVSRYVGLLASTLSHWEDAERHFEDALAANQRMGARPWLAHTQEDYARMLLERNAHGDREKAQDLLDAALATYRELGMDGPLAKAAAVAARS
jgi:predicted ATPase/DNA-binding SARP family transcriptional activator